MTKIYCSLLAFCFCFATAGAQKTLTAIHLDETPILDGRLTDSCWRSANSTDFFTTSYPVFGDAPDQTTKVWLYSTGDALYIAAFCSARKLRNEGTIRDDNGTGDWFRVGLDTWNDDQNAFYFQVSASGVQYDAQVGANQVADNWDAVWQSKVAASAEGWSLEMRIPFTALRFPAHGEQHWGLQFTRFERSTGFEYTWSPQDPLIEDEVLQFGQLEGLGTIRQKARMSVSVSGDGEMNVVEHATFFYEAEPFTATAGVDGRLGLGSNTTLDFTLLPPYSTAEYPFLSSKRAGYRNEPLPEPRQLLAEGTPMFGKSGILWRYPALQQEDFTRRLLPGEFIINFTSPVRNTARLSTRLRGNVGLGIQNVVMGPSEAEIFAPPAFQSREEVLQPVSNYTFITAEKSLANNSWVNFSNATLRAGPGLNSNISALDFRLRDHSNRFEVAGHGQLNFHEYVKGTQEHAYEYNLSLAKANGPLTWRIAHYSPELVIPDPLLGVLYSNRRKASTTASLERRRFQTAGRLHSRVAYVMVKRLWTNDPNYENTLVFSAGASVLTRHFRAFSANVGFQPMRKEEPLPIGGTSELIRRLSLPLQIGVSASTDQRKSFTCTAGASSSFHLQGEKASFYLHVNPVWVVNRRFVLESSNQLEYRSGELKFQGAVDSGLVFLRSQFLTFQQTIRANWYIRPKFNLYVQSTITSISPPKEEVVKLQAGHDLEPYPAFAFLSSGKYKEWNLGFGMQWLFAPGSQLRLNHNFRFRYITDGTLFQEYLYNRGLNQTTTNLSFICLLNAGAKQSMKNGGR